jgi:hypothetical protein
MRKFRKLPSAVALYPEVTDDIPQFYFMTPNTVVAYKASEHTEYVDFSGKENVCKKGDFLVQWPNGACISVDETSFKRDYIRAIYKDGCKIVLPTIQKGKELK